MKHLVDFNNPSDPPPIGQDVIIVTCYGDGIRRYDLVTLGLTIQNTYQFLHTNTLTDYDFEGREYIGYITLPDRIELEKWIKKQVKNG